MKIRNYWTLCALALVAAGCTDLAEQQEPARRAQFESSIEAYRIEHSGRPGYVLEALNRKQIVNDMNLDEARLVLDAQGIVGQQTERLWCDKKPVAQCTADCANCRGLIVARWGSVVYIKGKGANPVVFDIRHTDNDRPGLGAFLAEDKFLSYEIARAIEAGQVITGMTLEQIRQTLPGHELGETYTCNNKVAPACTTECASCVVDFVWQGNAVSLESKANDTTPRVTRIAPFQGR
jgi:hypothetical protein